MSDPAKIDAPSCGAGCQKCSAADQCTVPADGLAGWRMVLSSVAVFLLPLALATTGAVLAGREPTAQFLGTLGGLAVGLGLGVVLAWAIRRTVKEKV